MFRDLKEYQEIQISKNSEIWSEEREKLLNQKAMKKSLQMRS